MSTQAETEIVNDGAQQQQKAEPLSSTQADPRDVLVARMRARAALVESGDMDGSAIAELLDQAAEMLDRDEYAGLSRTFAQACRAADAKASKQPRPPKTKRPTPQSTVEAIMYSVRTRGVAALDEPETRLRMKQCDDAALKQIAARIAKLDQKAPK